MEYEINLEALVKMKRVFEEADEDGSGELDIEEFTQKLGPHLGQHLSEAQIAQLFLKIDADCGGTIDWTEFTNYFFLQRGVTNAGEDQQRFCLYPKATWRKEWQGAVHKDAVQRVCCCRALDKYITCGKDGAFRLWHMRDLAPVQAVQNGSAWVNDVAYLEGPRKLLVASSDRSITYYGVVRHSFEYIGRLTATGQLGSPQCLAVLEGSLEPRIFYGDSTGAVVHLRCGPPEPHTARALAQKDYEVLHQDHADWVTQLLDIPDAGLLSSSLDSTVKILDLGRGAVSNTFALHRKAVRSMAYSRAFSLVASAGPERSVLLWPPKGNINRKIGELAGHSAGVVQVVMADARSQAITLSEDHIIRVWDLRNHGCIQTINRADWGRGEDWRAEALYYDTRHHRLLTACAGRPSVWDHRAMQSDTGHSGRLCSALFNSAFGVVVSGDQAGGILMWNAQNGQCEGGFSFNGGSGSKLTALAFDANQRRLLTASETGELKIWNFNSGAELREYRHKEGRKEITAVAFLAPPISVPLQEGAMGVEEGEGKAREAGAEPSSAGGSGGLVGAEGGSWPGAAGSHVAAGGGSGSEDEDEEVPPTLVLATGWSRNVCIWQDSNDRVVTDYQRLEAHEADVLCMACLDGRLVATGDFEGEIKLWDLQSSSCMACLSYGGAQWERAVDKLAFLPASAGRGGHPLLLACGQDGLIKAWQLQLLQQDAGASAGGARPAGAVGTGASGCVKAAAAASPGGLACTATFITELRGAQQPRDCVTAVATDAACRRLVTGDSSGHVRVWDVSSVDVSGGPAAAAASFRVLARWRARQAAIMSAQHIPQHDLLLLTSDDSTVSMWTLQGGLVGIFGQHSWDLGDRSTWHDHSGAGLHQPLVEEGEGLTPREIIERTPRRTHWGPEPEGPAAGSPAASPRRGNGGSDTVAADSGAGGQGSLPGSPQAAPHLHRMTLPPALRHLVGAAQQRQGQGAGEDASASSGAPSSGEEAQSPGAAAAAAPTGCALAEAAQQSRAARSSWVIPLAVQAHGALDLHGVAAVPADFSQIWASIKGYHGTGRERRSVKAGRGTGFASSKQRPSDVQAIMNKTAPAFGRSAASQHLSLVPEREKA